MSFFSWLNGNLSSITSHRTHRPPRRPLPFRPQLELLEDRTLLSAAPVVISQNDLHLGSIGALAVSPDAHKVYLGRFGSWSPGGMNLAVLTLDDSGKPVGDPTLYADSALPLPLGDRSSVSSIVVDAAYHKLYLTTYTETESSIPLTSNLAADDLPNLTVYDLDADGNPVGSPRTYATGFPSTYTDMALSPTLNRLYLVNPADTSGSIEVYNLDAFGEPQQGTLQDFGFDGSTRTTNVALSPDGKTLYGAGYGQVEMVTLDASGLPEASSFRRFPVSDTLGYFTLSYTPQALYLSPDALLPYQSRVQPLEVWPLGSDGAPMGTAPEELSQYSGRAFAVDGAHQQLWVAADDTFLDACTQAPVPDGVTPLALPLDGSTGSPAGPPVSFPVSYGQAGEFLAVSAEGTPVLLTQANPPKGNQVSNYYLQATVVAATLPDGTSPTSLPVWLNEWSLPNAPEVLLSPSLPLGQPSSAYSLDVTLKGVNGPVQMSVSALNPAPGGPATLLQSLTLQLDVYQGDPATGGTLVKSMTQTVQGNSVGFIVPGYGFLPPGQRSATTELMTDYANQVLLATAAQVGLTPDERPKQFVIGADSILGFYDASVPLLQSYAQTVALLGMNTVNAYWWNGIPPDEVNAILDSYGFQRRQAGDHGALPPLSVPGEDPNIQTLRTLEDYFAVDVVQSQADRTTWAEQLAQFGAGTDGAPGSVVDFKLADEPGWYYPGVLQQAQNDPAWLVAFRDYLQGQGLQPDFFGQASWDTVSPIGATDGAVGFQPTDLPSRRLFYWTLRYFTDSAAQGMLLDRNALQAVFPNLQTVDVNFDVYNWPGAWYTASPDQPSGTFDMMTSGRLNAHTLWTEDLFPNGYSEMWSFLADAERSAAMEGNQQFGGYVEGNVLYGEQAGASYKILSLLGHGAKTVDLYLYGPYFGGDSWSALTGIYGPIADALKLVGRSEDVLYPGQPARGKVAILLAGASNLWDDNGARKQYDQEVQGLYYALSQAGYTVDFVDDTDLAQGALAARGYTTLYVTSPNLSAAAQTQVVAWVNGGGTLAVTPGGGVADEYNTSTTTLDAVLGLQPGTRTAVRDAAPSYVFQSDKLTLGNPMDPADHLFGSGQMDLSGVIEALQPADASNPLFSVEATLGTGAAGITLNHYGKGTAIAYGFFPGQQFFVSPGLGLADPGWLPTEWGQQQRQLAVKPAALANTPRPVVVSQDGVEADLLTSAKGDAIVLLNWTDQPLAQLTVTVPDAAQFTRVRSAQGAALQTQVNADGSLTITLPLANVDVLTLDSPEVTVSDTGALQVGNLAPGSAHTITIENVSGGVRLTLDGQHFQYPPGQISSVVVNGGTSNDVVNLEGSLPTVPITLNLGGPSTVNVGAPGNTLDPLQGSLSIAGNGSTAVNFNNQGADPSVSHGDTWTANHVDFNSFYHPQAFQVDFSGVSRMTLSDPALTTNMHLFYAMPAAGSLTINGAGNDTLQALAPDVGQNDWWITGPNTGNLNHIVAFNNVYYLLTGYSGTDVFHLLPDGSQSRIGKPGLGGIAVLDLSGYTPGAVVRLPGLSAWGSVGVDTQFDGIQRILGTAGADTLVGPDTATTWDITGTDAGVVHGAAFYAQVFLADVAFTGFETLVGGSGGNTFQFAPDASVSGQIDGGGGVNALDYSAWATGVRVNLSTGAATAVAGGVLNFQNATGGSGDDLLAGNAASNVLVGGAGNDVLLGGAGKDILQGGDGRDLLAGGSGSDVLDGGGGDDILIGGTIAYFDESTGAVNQAAIDAVMKEWTRTDLDGLGAMQSYNTRMGDLRGGGGLNGSYLLSPAGGNATVFDDLASDTLTGGAGLDWFFANKKQDTITDQAAGEKVS
jgi:Ca2+-binding RTX toxin-like protein